MSHSHHKASLKTGINGTTGVVESATLNFAIGTTSGARYHIPSPPLLSTPALEHTLGSFGALEWVHRLAEVLKVPSREHAMVVGMIREAMSLMPHDLEIRKKYEMLLAEDAVAVEVAEEREEDEEEMDEDMAAAVPIPRNRYKLKQAAMDLLWDMLWKEEHETEMLLQRSSSNVVNPGDAVDTAYGPGILHDIDHTLCWDHRGRYCVWRVQLSWGLVSVSSQPQRNRDAASINLSRKKFMLDSVLPSLLLNSSDKGDHYHMEEDDKADSEQESIHFIERIRRLVTISGGSDISFDNVQKFLTDCDARDRQKLKFLDPGSAIDTIDTDLKELTRLQLKRRREKNDLFPTEDERLLATKVQNDLVDFLAAGFDPHAKPGKNAEKKDSALDSDGSATKRQRTA